MPIPFLDINILLRHLLADHPEHSPKATAFLARIEQGQQKVRTADTVIFETVFTLQRHYRIAKARIAETVLPLIELPGIVLPGKRKFRKVFALYDGSFARSLRSTLGKTFPLPMPTTQY